MIKEISGWFMTVRNEDAIDNNKKRRSDEQKYTNADLVKDMRHVQMFSFDFFFSFALLMRFF